MSSSSALRTAALALGAAFLVAACGFHMRGYAPLKFSTLYISAPGNAQILTELRRAIEGNGGTKLVDKPTDAQAVLDITAVVDDKQVLSLTGGGRVQEYALSKRVNFSLHDAAGKELMPAAEITIRRSYTFNESEVLARLSEEERTLKEMQNDAVQQILRRLQAAKAPT
jgi:LPS-assembly lipoprotein